ncbi:hypothetical protein SCOR_11135 [Sulfidibacter corallicola]|uniref:Uncharacterized protein n=1 Tax=Sulfidibacter corallicola TaxID=2818388 RepID=A0A8A4TH36_SULCO|nr:hypothetical protein [Sulfidibacter corallicola]QTD48111.1 hypothetical protein J3U87_21205 [Sulfidibacter corallicola]
MGKLRTEPKHKSFLKQEEYDDYLGILQEAQRAAEDNNVYWDLEKNEKASQVKKAFLYVSRKENIDVTIRQVRGANSLAFHFKKGKAQGGTRMSAKESRARILKCLKSAGVPLKKNQIIRDTGISASTWNIRIKELLKSKEVKRQGDRRDTTYTVA